MVGKRTDFVLAAEGLGLGLPKLIKKKSELFETIFRKNYLQEKEGR